MKEWVTNLWCDACYDEHDGLKTKADVTTPPMSMNVKGKAEPKTLDLCAMHEKALVSPLLDLLAEHGARLELVRPERPPQSRVTGTCPVCHVEVHRSSLISHLWGRHREDKRPPEPAKCPDCAFPGRGNVTSSQAMGTHRRKEHGRDSLAEVLAGVPGYVPAETAEVAG